MAWVQKYDGAEPQRINKWMAQAGVCSRREAEDLIAQGLVSIDGQTITEPGHKIQPGQTLTLAGRAQGQLESKMSVLIHKPEGYVSAHPEPHQRQAVELLTRDNLWAPREEAGRIRIPDAETSLPPLGRLDMDSRGLLILSEDGVLAKAVIGPESELEKEYLVRVRGEITEGKLKGLRHGLTLDGRVLRPAKVTVVEEQQLRFILTEGRNRQVRRMCEAMGLYVFDLFRIRIGPIHLGGLPEGCWRPISAQERSALIAASAGPPPLSKQRPQMRAGPPPPQRRDR